MGHSLPNCFYSSHQVWQNRHALGPVFWGVSFGRTQEQSLFLSWQPLSGISSLQRSDDWPEPCWTLCKALKTWICAQAGAPGCIMKYVFWLYWLYDAFSLRCYAIYVFEFDSRINLIKSKKLNMKLCVIVASESTIITEISYYIQLAYIFHINF